MTDDLARIIKRAYPAGTTDGLNESTLENEARDVRLRAALQAATIGLGVNWDTDKDRLTYQFRFIEKWHPEFSQWIWEMDNAEKIAWIGKNGAPYAVLWLKVSRVADYYLHFFNFWMPRGDTGYLDIDFKQPPNVAWTARLAQIMERLEQSGFRHLTPELAAEKTPFVLERDYDSIPDDDPRWDDENFEPPWVRSTVHECIFSH